MGRKRKAVYRLCGLLAGCLCIAAVFNYAYWNVMYVDSWMWREEVNTRPAEPFAAEIRDVDVGLMLAEQKAKEWNPHAKLHHITCRYEGKAQIEGKRGTLTYEFYINTKDILGRPHLVTYYIVLNLERQEIERVLTLTDWRESYTDGFLRRDSFSVEEVLSAVRSETTLLDEIYRYDSPSVTVEFYWHSKDEVRLYADVTAKAASLKYQLSVSYPERKIGEVLTYRQTSAQASQDGT